MNNVSTQKDFKYEYSKLVKTRMDKRKILKFLEMIDGINYNYPDDFQVRNIFFYEDTLEPRQYCFATYNIKYNSNFNYRDKYEKPLARNTIFIERNTDHNVFYTLNALNKIIEKQSGGKGDNKYVVDWSVYTNKILTTLSSEDGEDRELIIDNLIPMNKISL